MVWSEQFQLVFCMYNTLNGELVFLMMLLSLQALKYLCDSPRYLFPNTYVPIYSRIQNTCESKWTIQGTSVAVQWLRFCPSNAGSAGSIPGQGTKIPHAVWHGQKKIKERKKTEIEDHIDCLIKKKMNYSAIVAGPRNQNIWWTKASHYVVTQRKGNFLSGDDETKEGDR